MEQRLVSFKALHTPRRHRTHITTRLGLHNVRNSIGLDVESTWNPNEIQLF